MKILVACEESQVVTKAMRRLGHEAYSCDLIEQSGGHPEWHIMQDVIPLLNGRCTFKTTDGTEHAIVGRWDMIVAFPPCTFMSKAGARWMYPKAGQVDQERLKKAMKAKAFFLAIANADCDKIAIENPRPLKIVGLPVPTQIIQPYQFKHPFSKATCLWLKGLPLLIPTGILKDYKPFLPSNTGAFSRGGGGSRGVAHDAKTAAKTFTGVGDAMAEQWAGPCAEGCVKERHTMDAMTTPALILLNRYRKGSLLTPQQYKTIRGQILAGNAEGALRGLQKLLNTEKRK